MSLARRLRNLSLLARRCWTHLGNMDVTQLDLFRHCRFLRHAGKVGGAGGRRGGAGLQTAGGGANATPDLSSRFLGHDASLDLLSSPPAYPSACRSWCCLCWP